MQKKEIKEGLRVFRRSEVINKTARTDKEHMYGTIISEPYEVKERNVRRGLWKVYVKYDNGRILETPINRIQKTDR